MIKHESLISRNEACKILATHGWSPDQPTAINPITYEMVEGSSFNESLGVLSAYDKHAVYCWLGY